MWTFVVWGLFHGTFLIIERAGLKEWMEKHRIIRHLYVLLVVMVGWVFFRSDDFTKAGEFLMRMAFLGDNTNAFFGLSQCVNRALVLALIAGVIGSLPVAPILGAAIDRAIAAGEGARSWLVDLSAGLSEFAILAAIFIASTALSAAGTYNPFIYFRF